ncbi:MAG: hypothetical protein QOI08_1359 [Actinomycetota bacterium]|nr:hypothetical protein [Actinomycetota bacterium]
MTVIEDALFDLAEHLDHPGGEELEATVLRRINEPAPFDASPRSRVRTWLAVAAVVVVVAGALVASAPARRAIADWLGIGAVEVRRVDRPLPNGPSTHTVPGSLGPTSPAVDEGLQIATAQRRVRFTIAVPRDPTAGTRSGVEVDSRTPGGLVVLRYPRFTLVEIASQGDVPVVGKLVAPGEHVDPATVGGAPGFWVAGAHQVTYLDRSGRVRTDTVRRSGPVLVWVAGGVTYRIEGLDRVTAARIAASVH